MMKKKKKTAGCGGYDSKVSGSQISAAISSVQGGLTGNLELNTELMTKARGLKEEFEEHLCRLSSGSWSKVPLELGREKGGDCLGRNYSRGKMYSKYMEKRDARLRTENWLNRAAIRDAKLRALNDDLQRCRVKLQEEVAFLEDNNYVNSGAQPSLQKFWSTSVLSNQTAKEQGINIHPREEDNLLTISRSHEPRKVSPVRKRPSSSIVRRPVAVPVPQPSNRMTRSTSMKPRSNPPNSHDLRKENGKTPPVIGRRTIHSNVKDVVRTRNSREEPQKSQSSLRKSSVSPLGRRNISSRITADVKVDARMKGSQIFNGRYSTSLETGSFIRQAKPRKILCQPRNDKSGHNISVEYNDTLSKTEGGVLGSRFDEEESHPELRGKEASLNMQKEQEYDSSMVLMADAAYTCKTCSSVLQNVEDTGVSHSMVPDERTKDCVTERICDHCNGVDFRVPRSGLGSDSSKNLESTDSDTLLAQFRGEPSMDTAFEQPNSTSLTEMIPAISDVGTLKADTSAINSPRGQSRIGTPRSSKRFLIFSKRSRGDDSLEGLVSTMTSEGDEEEIFNEVLLLEEQVRLPLFPVHSSLERIKRKGGNSRGRSPKANGSCFSLSSLRCRGEDTNPRQPIPREQIRR